MEDGQGKIIPLKKALTAFRMLAMHSADAALARRFANADTTDVNGMAQESCPGTLPMTWLTPPKTA